MSILDAEQSARYIDSLMASVQALEADLAATRERLRQVMSALGVEPFTTLAGAKMDLPQLVPIAVDRANRLNEAYAERLLGTEQAQARIAERQEELATVRRVLNADLKTASDRVLTLELEARQAQARIAALEQERKRFAGVLATVTAVGYTPICEDPEHTQHSCMLCAVTWRLGEPHPQNGCLAADARVREEGR